jgi:hypothetical protein
MENINSPGQTTKECRRSAELTLKPGLERIKKETVRVNVFFNTKPTFGRNGFYKILYEYLFKKQMKRAMSKTFSHTRMTNWRVPSDN